MASLGWSVLTISLQVSVDGHHGVTSLEHSARISTGPISINYSVNYWAPEGRLELWGHSQHDSEALLQAGIPGEADLQTELQMHGEFRSGGQHLLGPGLAQPFLSARETFPFCLFSYKDTSIGLDPNIFIVALLYLVTSVKYEG